jgi:hypothetical protein
MKRRDWSRRLTHAGLVMLALVAPLGSWAGTVKIAQQWIRWGNGLKTEFLIFNALSTNPAANLALTRHPLSTDTFSKVDELRNALHDPAARLFMKYLVSCALGSDQSVSWTPMFPGTPPQTWHGGGAVCTDWGNHAPTQDCLELVSACILGRNNPKGVMVRILMQGGGTLDPPDSLKPLPRVTPAQFLPSMKLDSGSLREAQPILSFQPCDTAAGGDCGWRSLSVGACSPGALVTFSVSSSGGKSVCGALRACVGSRGCDRSEEIGNKAAFCSAGSMDFTCPAEGMFSVMASFTSSTSGPYDDLWDSQGVAGTGARFVSEQELFPRREGAFYGNIFGTDAIMSGLSVTFEPSTQETILRMTGTESVYVRQGEGWCKRLASDPPDAACTEAIPRVGSGRAVYDHMYVCSAPGWAGDEVDLPGRVCALPHNEENCASHLMGECLDPVGGGCAPDGDNLDLCQGQEVTRWAHPITTFMSQ